MRRLSLILTFILVLLMSTTLSAQADLALTRLDEDVDYAVQWMQLLYNRVEGESRNVPQAARIYAYAGVTLYLALMPTMTQPVLDIAQLNDLPPLPEADPALDYDGLSIVNGALSTVIPGLMAPLENRGTITTTNNFNTAESNGTRRAVSAVSGRQYGERRREVDGATVDRSVAYGEQLGQAILE
ncbi:MAG: hypothetical protein SF029_11575 [bacterium]|nr:hypothetical protein [bacterium]